MIKWIFEHLGIVVFLAIFLSQILRAVFQSKKTKARHEAQRDDSAEARRLREVQEQIRRQIAERRAGGNPAPAPQPTFSPMTEAPPVARPQTTQLPELFGGPLGRMLEELQKRAQPVTPPPAPPPVYSETRNMAELERQQQLADKLRSLQEDRTLVQRRTAQVAGVQLAADQSETGLRTATRAHLTDDLRDPQALRRAFVLREILGQPVGLR